MEPSANGVDSRDPEPENGSVKEAKTETVDNASTTEKSLRGLEMKYMELLEKRIADLEAKLKDAEKVSGLHGSSCTLSDKYRTRRRKTKAKRYAVLCV
jgi:hypothetical protein